MNKKILFPLILLLLIIPVVYGVKVKAGEPYILDTVPRCQGDIVIRPYVLDIRGSFSFEGCKLRENNSYYYCPCDPTYTNDLILITEPGTQGVIKFYSEYYIGIPNYKTKRNQEYDNVEIKDYESAYYYEKIKGFMPLFIIIAIIFALAAIILVGYITYKYILQKEIEEFKK